MPSLHDLASDEALVALCVARADREAFATLVRRHQGRLRQYLRALCANPAAADELAQETFLRAWTALPEFRAQCRFSTWLVGIARNLWLDALRRSEHRLHVQLDEAAWQSLLASPALADDGGRSRDDALDLQRALATLSPEQREVIAHCYFADLTQAEAAAALAMPLGTIKTHVNRALARLRAHLDAGAAPPTPPTEEKP